MKTFFSVFFAILAAAAVIFAGLWAKSRVDSWEQAWRSCEAQMSAIFSSEQAYSGASRYSAGSSSEVAIHEIGIALQRIQDDQVQIAQIEHTMVAILEHKPFGLPLTAAERKELESAKEDIRKHPQTSEAATK